MIVITSAAYVGPEFQAEFGKLPPSMLPVGNRRLFEHQVAALRKCFPDQPIHLSLPEHFTLPVKDAHRLRQLAVELVLVPEDLTLAESLLYVLNSIGDYTGTLRLLHGDTLLDDFPDEQDLLAIVHTQENYDWEVERTGLTDELVWCGYFSFSRVRALVRNLTAARGKFVDAVRAYEREQPLLRRVVTDWHDLGHVNTYYMARARMTTQRAFNTMRITAGCVQKSGQPARKIAAEGMWFAQLPWQLKRYTPQLITVGERDGAPYYVLEYLCLAPLNELYVHGINPPYFWAKIFRHCDDWLTLCRRHAPPHQRAAIAAGRHAIIATKTRERLRAYAGASSIALDRATRINGQALPSLDQIAEHCIELALAAPCLPAIQHGDLCFSNMLFDSRADALKVIDPRGIGHDGVPTLTGDLCYDLAKLTHSVIGLYDYIIAGAFACQQPGPLEFTLHIQADARIEQIQQAFLARSFCDAALRPADVMAHTVLLFLSMLPLHADNPARQSALLANGLRLYARHLHTGS